MACHVQQRSREREGRWEHLEVGDGTPPFYLSPVTEGPNAQHFLGAHPCTSTGCHAVCLWCALPLGQGAMCFWRALPLGQGAVCLWCALPLGQGASRVTVLCAGLQCNGLQCICDAFRRETVS